MNSSSQTAPVLSVVIASIVGQPFIDDCLASVFAQKNAPPFEVIVVDCRGPENVARLRKAFPKTRFIEVAHRESVPQLRAIGVQHAEGSSIAVLE
jgi:glycosyltransferase involved in cell wall biosynthesis